MTYHFIGIKGTGMSALASIMHDLGYNVQGSDKEEHFFTQIPLDERGIKCLPFDKNNIQSGQTIVAGATFKNHEEVKRAKELGLDFYFYNQMLGKLTKIYQTIAISGCHGKTTTTSLMSHVFKNTKGANYLIGDGTGHVTKGSDTFIIEACEYQRHFLDYYPKYAVFTNIDLDHIDYYKNLEDMKQAYLEFSRNVSDKIIACGDDKNIRDLKLDNVIYYGFEDTNDIYATNIKLLAENVLFDVYYQGKYLDRFAINFFGKHHILNTLSVIMLSLLEGIKKEDLKQQLLTFQGPKRRFIETKVEDMVLVDDYAHHPNEIKATIETAKLKYPEKDIIGVFQGCTFSRVEIFYQEICQSLKDLKQTYFMDIAPTREIQEDYPEITHQLFLDCLEGSKYLNMDNVEELANYKNSVILFMSLKEMEPYINKVKEKIINENRKKKSR